MALKDLKKEINYKWKIQSFVSNGTKGICVAYIDARQASDLLDDALGQENWKDEYKEINGNLFCGVSVKISGEWVTKWDCGVESNVEKEKGESSDAFKRACVKWGVGRFLYSLEHKFIDVSNKKPVDEQGNIIWDLTKYFSKGEQTTVSAKKQPAVDVNPHKKRLFVKIQNSLGIKTTPTFQQIQETIQNRAGVLIKTAEDLKEDEVCKHIIELWTDIK